MDPFDTYAEALRCSKPIPGSGWRFTKLQTHCFLMEIERVSVFSSEEQRTMAWFKRALLEYPELVMTTSSDLYAFIEGFLPAAQAHLTLLRPRDPNVRRVKSRHTGDTPSDLPEQVVTRIDFSHRTSVWLPCGHTTDEHVQAFREWYEQNVAPSRYWWATLHMLWEMPASELSPGERYIASDDMELQITEQLRRLKRRMEMDDRKLIDSLILDCRQERDHAEAIIENMHNATYRDAERQLRERFIQLYRIFDRYGWKIVTKKAKI